MNILLVVLCIIEALLYTYCKNIAGPVFSPVLILINSCWIAFLSLKLSNTYRQKQYKLNSWQKTACVGIFTGISAWLTWKFVVSFPLIPMDDTRNSDVMITFIHLVKNFMAGRPAYEPFMNQNYVIFPSYMPLQWLPYTVAEWLHFDYRWVAVTVLWLAQLFFLAKTLGRNGRAHPAWQLTAALWPSLIFALLVQEDLFSFLITLESLAAGYYLLLATAIDKRKWVLTAVALAVCALSRMSIVLWAPLCVLTFFVYGEQRKALSITAICALFVIVFYCPFLINNPGFFFNPYQSYSVPIEAIWQKKLLMNGLSFNTWGINYLHGDIHYVVATYNRIHLAACLLCLGAMSLYLPKARKKYTRSSYLLFSLKIYLTVFYTFIQLPFLYLYIVPLMVTAALLSHAFAGRQVEEIQ